MIPVHSWTGQSWKFVNDSWKKVVYTDQEWKEIDQALTVNDTRGFLASCRRAIQEQLGLVWDTESSAITLGDLQKRLPGDSGLLTVFKAADESAYGGQELSQQEMQEYADRLKNELEGLL